MVNKLAKNIVAFFSIVILAVLTIGSMFFITTVKNFNENVMINLTTSIGLILYLVIGAIIILCSKTIEEKLNKSKSLKKIILITAICIYAIISIYWVNISNVPPVDDSKSVNDLAISFANRKYGRNKKQWIYRKISKPNWDSFYNRNFIQDI